MDASITALIGLAVLFPFVIGFICLGLHKNSRARKPFIIVTAVVLTVVSILLFLQVFNHGAIHYTPPIAWDWIILIADYVLLAYFLYVGIKARHFIIVALVLLQLVFLPLFVFHWAGAVPIEVHPALHIDMLAVIMCLIISIIGSLICVYGIHYMRDHERHLGLTKTRQHEFFFFMIIFLGAMNGLVFANSLLWLFFFWELTTLCCYRLILHDRTKEATGSAIRALWMNLIGGAACVGAMIVLFNQTHDATTALSLQNIIASPAAGIMLFAVALLCLTAFTKAAQVPFQSWLLGAMVAPVPVSALLHSSTMVKAGVYLAVRLSPAFHDSNLSIAIAVFGAFVFLVTAVLAISQTESKRVLAYSTISNLGLIICLAGINTPLALTAAMALILFHAISKALLFLGVGIVDHHIWSKDIENMEGLVRKLPLISWVLIVGIISMLLMPFGVLVSKWAGIEAAGTAIGGSGWFILVMVLLVAGSAATIVFWSKWMGRLLTQVPGVGSPRREPISFSYHMPVLSLIIGAVLLSIFIAPVLSGLIMPALPAAYPWPFATGGWFWLLRSGVGFFAAWPLAIVVAAILVIPKLAIKMKKEDLRAPYLCGENVEVSTPEFRSLADERTELKTGGFYLGKVLGERNLNKWVNPIGVIILVALFCVVLL